MGKLFHHHATNDLIRISNGTQTYVDSGDAFIADGGAMPPQLVDAIERIYEPGVRHAISSGSAVIGGGPQPWLFGDEVITKIGTYLAAQVKRTTSPPKVEATAVPTGKSTGTVTVAS